MTWKNLAAVAFCYGLLTTSCLKPPSDDNDNGPTAAASDVQNALISAWGSADPLNIQNNEFMYLEQEQRISNYDTKIVYKESTQVTQRVLNTDTVDYTLLIRSTAIDSNGNFKPITSAEQAISVPKTSATPPAANISASQAAFPTSLDRLQKSMANGLVGLYDGDIQQRFLGVQTVQSMLSACVNTPTWDVTCHNLQVTEGLQPVPDLIAAKSGCGGFSNCQMHFQKVAFDLVVNILDPTTNQISPQKVIYQLTFSQDVPYLSHLIEFCYEGLVATANQKIPVTVCNRVEDFDPGQNTP